MTVVTKQQREVVHPGTGRGQRREFMVSNQLFLVPIAVVLLALIIVPLGQTAFYSLTNFSGYSPKVNFVGFRNYQALLSDQSMTSALAFTSLYTGGTVIVVTCIAIPLAVVLNQNFIGRNFVRSMFFFPAILSAAILGLVWQFMLSPLGSGLVNSIVAGIFKAAPIPWLSSSSLAKASVILVGVWVQSGWHAVLYLAYLQSIPQDYYEAATIDGASGFQQFFSITLPMLTPAISVSAILLVTAGLKVYDLPFTLTGGGPGYSTFTVTQAIIQNGITEGRVGEASALSVVFTLVLAIVVLGQLAVAHRLERRVS